MNQPQVVRESELDGEAFTSIAMRSCQRWPKSGRWAMATAVVRVVVRNDVNRWGLRLLAGTAARP
jgi:RNA:NAD 2'-phosphotransferase (TPT1/KptA family)